MVGQQAALAHRRITAHNDALKVLARCNCELCCPQLCHGFRWLASLALSWTGESDVPARLKKGASMSIFPQDATRRSRFIGYTLVGTITLMSIVGLLRGEPVKAQAPGVNLTALIQPGSGTTEHGYSTGVYNQYTAQHCDIPSSNDFCAGQRCDCCSVKDSISIGGSRCDEHNILGLQRYRQR